MNDKNRLKSVYWTVGMLLVHYIAGCGVLALLVYVVPHYMAIFAELEAELPAMTQLLISLATAGKRYGYLITGPAFVVDLAVFIGLSQLPSGKHWATIAWFVAVLGAMILFAGFVAVALFVTMLGLLESLG
jgi:type II secretory pathway component PulF